MIFFVMDYTMEDTQNSAPDVLEATKLNSSGQRSDTQSVTKRFGSCPTPTGHSQVFNLSNESRTNPFDIVCKLS